MKCSIPVEKQDKIWDQIYAIADKWLDSLPPMIDCQEFQPDEIWCAGHFTPDELRLVIAAYEGFKRECQEKGLWDPSLWGRKESRT